MTTHKTFQLVNPGVALNCIEYVKLLPTGEDDPYQVQITQGEDLRSLAQNRLYWKHIGEWSKQTGLAIHDEVDMQGLHYNVKRMFLHPLYMAESTKKAKEYQGFYETICKASEATGESVEFRRIHNRILSSKDASVKVFRKFIDDYWLSASEQGIYLTDPNTFYHEHFQGVFDEPKSNG